MNTSLARAPHVHFKGIAVAVLMFKIVLPYLRRLLFPVCSLSIKTKPQQSQRHVNGVKKISHWKHAELNLS